MAQMWFGSLIPWLDPNGDPYVGAKVEFFDTSTTTPQVVYTDSSLSTAAGSSYRTANEAGRFRALFLNPDPGLYRVKITASDGTIIEDVDGISVPQNADFVPPDAGETSPELLASTGDLKARYGTGTHAGWVRLNGRTIGSSTSGATERANADCEDLFKHLWDEDPNLVVSGDRGANAASDWAANKTIALPSGRNRILVGLGDMGATDVDLIPDDLFDGEGTNTTLGATAGVAQVSLSTDEIPVHRHTKGTLKMPNHGHVVRTSRQSSSDFDSSGGFMLKDENQTNEVAFTGTPSATRGEQIGGSGEIALTGEMDTVGAGEAHTNMPPSLLITLYMKL